MHGQYSLAGRWQLRAPSARARDGVRLLSVSPICRRRLALRRRGCEVCATPCVVIIAPHGPDTAAATDQLATELRKKLEPECVVVTVEPRTIAERGPARELTRRVRVEPHPGWACSVTVSQPADAIMAVLDSKQGFLKCQQLQPVLTVTGPHRGHALGSVADTNAAVAMARQASIVGVPSVALCLASSDGDMRTAVDAGAHVVQQVSVCGCWGIRVTHTPRVLCIDTVWSCCGVPHSQVHIAKVSCPVSQACCFRTHDAGAGSSEADGRLPTGRELAWPDAQLAHEEAAAARRQLHDDCWALGA